ncbi:S-glutathionyl-(chloro)hydroquinone reductase [Trapelia coarctata]|nr:S-glutathionyl-(chloro)hydroquinone reductase [Trapelia coarctata]
MSTDSKITNWADSKTGEFKRGQSAFRNWISKKPGAEFPPEQGRYHLYVSYACPWAHRTLIARKLKGLESIIDFTTVHEHMGEKGWRFVNPSDPNEKIIEAENVRPDPVHPQFTHLRDIYFSVDPEYRGRFTVPTLYDVKQNKIVNNESSEILRMFYTEFDDLIEEKYRNVDLFPKELQADIEETNKWTYDEINNGVYKSGFATTQDAYEKALLPLFRSLDRANTHLASQPGPYYFGSHITEADIRLYTTIIRFDAVYVQHFKCNIKDIRSGFPALHKWGHYTRSHSQINPYGIVPVGPVPDILPVDEEVEAVKAAVKAGLA